ncbi:hypothetical protein GCM10022220_35620 [Actinocatenispora rupis]|uniref:Uncharacterized protein n=1 Tax=Actinocatenispora rupis TaxID=519421 RepID=A0A8J3J0K8_9ACTN|nr:hypothetical protein Aru02nite_32340 [Actinocatenispora rupis]
MWCHRAVSAPVYGVACSWFGFRFGGGRGKREPGAIPGLSRSGEWERPPSHSTGPRSGKRRPVGTSTTPTSPKTCQQRRTRGVRRSTVAWDDQRREPGIDIVDGRWASPRARQTFGVVREEGT